MSIPRTRGGNVICCRSFCVYYVHKEKSERVFSLCLLHFIYWFYWLVDVLSLSGIPFEVALISSSLLHEYTMNIIAGGQTFVTGDICVGVSTQQQLVTMPAKQK